MSPPHLPPSGIWVPAVKRFFADVAAKAPLPIVVYNFPGVTNGMDIDSDTIAEIVRQSKEACGGKSNVVGVKLTCAQVAKITRLTAAFGPEEFAVFGGQSDFLLGIYRLYNVGKVDEALALHRKAALAESPCKSGIASTKYASAIVSASRAEIKNAEDKFRPRTPYDEAGESAKANVRRIMTEIIAIEDSL
ncbi:hypothetical protein BDW68DRAFT_181563 [Aspergillus falconensis]